MEYSREDIKHIAYDAGVFAQDVLRIQQAEQILDQKVSAGFATKFDDWIEHRMEIKVIKTLEKNDSFILIVNKLNCTLNNKYKVYRKIKTKKGDYVYLFYDDNKVLNILTANEFEYDEM